MKVDFWVSASIQSKLCMELLKKLDIINLFGFKSPEKVERNT